jgi:hypothetical protein
MQWARAEEAGGYLSSVLAGVGIFGFQDRSFLRCCKLQQRAFFVGAPQFFVTKHQEIDLSRTCHLGLRQLG